MLHVMFPTINNIICSSSPREDVRFTEAVVLSSLIRVCCSPLCRCAKQCRTETETCNCIYRTSGCHKPNFTACKIMYYYYPTADSCAALQTCNGSSPFSNSPILQFIPIPYVTKIHKWCRAVADARHWLCCCTAHFVCQLLNFWTAHGSDADSRRKRKEAPARPTIEEQNNLRRHRRRSTEASASAIPAHHQQFSHNLPPKSCFRFLKLKIGSRNINLSNIICKFNSQKLKLGQSVNLPTDFFRLFCFFFLVFRLFGSRDRDSPWRYPSSAASSRPSPGRQSPSPRQLRQTANITQLQNFSSISQLQQLLGRQADSGLIEAAAGIETALTLGIR